MPSYRALARFRTGDRAAPSRAVANIRICKLRGCVLPPCQVRERYKTADTPAGAGYSPVVCARGGSCPSRNRRSTSAAQGYALGDDAPLLRLDYSHWAVWRSMVIAEG